MSQEISKVAERDQPSAPVRRYTWTAVARTVPAASAVFLALGVLAGLDGIAFGTLSPLRGLAWGALSFGCALFAFFGSRQGSERLIAQVAIAISIIALSSALVDVFAFSPCGFGCLNR
jgi:hypothetical protein